MGSFVPNQLWEDLFEKMPVGFVCLEVLHDSNGAVDYAFSYVNKVFEQIMGIDRALMTGRRISDFLPYMKDDYRMAAEQLSALAAGEAKKEEELYWPFTQRWLAFSMYTPQEGYIAAAVRDVTEMKGIRAKLNDVEEEIDFILQFSPDSITITDLEGNITDCNQNTLTMHGFSSKDEIIGRSAFDLIAPEDHEKAAVNMERVFYGHPIKDLLYRLHHMDGRDFPGMLSANLLRDAANIPKGFISITKDMSSLREIEAKRDKYNRALNLLLNNIPDAIIHLDNQWMVTYSNAAIEKEFCISSRQMENTSFKDYDLYMQSAEDWDQALDRVLKEGRQQEIFCDYKTDAGFKNYYIRIIPEKQDDKGNMNAVCIFHNITERRKAEEAIAYEKLKSEFFANLSHEFKTPLNVILGVVQLFYLYSEKDFLNTDRTKKHLQILKQNCYRLLRLINNLIDITKIDSGYYDLILEQIDMVDFVGKIADSVMQYMEQKGITLVYHSDMDALVTLCDPEKMERILLNLLSNAAKFTESGGRVDIHVQNTIDGMVIRVRDNGRGIPDDRKPLIFQRFRQVDKSFTRDHEGSGIGLSIVKSLVEMHGGTILFDSKEGQGTEFLITIPVNQDYSAISRRNTKRNHNRVERIQIEFSDIYF